MFEQNPPDQHADNLDSNSGSSTQILAVLSLIMMINALSYGIIIPLLYPYAEKFGIGPFGLSWLFVSFSLLQFLATPIIGRLSDRFGRKPLLVISIFGSALSLLMFAMAKNVAVLFLARMLDGITAGTGSVAQAVIADSTTGKERAKSFGLLGASFGFGFLFGPALGGLLTRYGITAPFWVAAGLSFLATILAAIFLKETAQKSNEEVVAREHLINPKKILAALSTPVVGNVLLLTFIVTMAQNMFVLGFQTYTVDILKLGASEVGILFASFGLVTILVQTGGLRILLQQDHSKRELLAVLIFGAGGLLLPMGSIAKLEIFTLVIMIYTLFFAPVSPLLSAVISERTNAEDQGGILGINQSYMSLGQIIGPIIAGTIGKLWSVPLIFTVSGMVMILGALSLKKIPMPESERADI